jgi:hypothetical protein
MRSDTDRRSAAQRTHRLAFLVLCAVAYLASLFLPWWTGGVTGFALTNDLGTLSVAIAIVILVIAGTYRRSSDERLPLLLRQLAIALVLLTVVSVLETWRFVGQGFGGRASYGAWVSVGITIVLLISALAVGAGGLGALYSRIKEIVARDIRRTDSAD